MGRPFGLCPKCGGETFDDIPCSNGCDDLPKPTDDIRRWLRRGGHYEKLFLAELDALEAENAALREALQTARVWGIAHGGYDASYARQLAAWVDGGFKGPSPTVDGGGGV